MTQASLFTHTAVPLCDLAVAATILAVFARAKPPPRVLVGVAAALSLWYAAVFWLAAKDVFLVTPQARIPLLPLAIVLPLAVALPWLFRSKSVAAALEATPLSHLIGTQVLRVMGAIFLVEWALGALPSAFALPAAVGDIATGLIAAPLALYVTRRGVEAVAPVLLWTALGLGDFVSAVATGFLSSPGRFQSLALDHPNLIGTAYPLALIPAFGVPLFIILHILTLWKLRRETSPAPAPRRLAHAA